MCKLHWCMWNGHLDFDAIQWNNLEKCTFVCSVFDFEIEIKTLERTQSFRLIKILCSNGLVFEWFFFLAHWAHRILAKNWTKIANEIWWIGYLYVRRCCQLIFQKKKTKLKKHERKTVSFVVSQSWAIVAINRQDLNLRRNFYSSNIVHSIKNKRLFSISASSNKNCFENN